MSAKCINVNVMIFEKYSVFLAIATNIAALLMTGFVLQGHIYTYEELIWKLSF